MRKTIACGLAIALLASSSAHAEGNVKTLLEDYERGGQSRVLVTLIAEQAALGLGWANTRLKTQERPQIYCPPPELTLRGIEVIDMLRRAVEADKAVENAPYGLALMLALEKNYPCPVEEPKPPKPMEPLSPPPPPPTSSGAAGRSSTPSRARTR